MDTKSEKYRHQCEVRYLLSIRHKYGLKEIRKLLSNPAFAPRLYQIQCDLAEQWRKGNRGTEIGLWL
ncbi:hypothetical protein UFOVP599_26 [uncultured Caudovirales phage]|uniref:Uncharacterized protein n=1 Tax=uncultured Caudovirales phage TaxID=2100421 RepID=A0A6J5N2T6_9CAUD|nr:hypothetical protein UFOVP599_26 [uncultured Caudovirales phage]